MSKNPIQVHSSDTFQILQTFFSLDIFLEMKQIFYPQSFYDKQQNTSEVAVRAAKDGSGNEVEPGTLQLTFCLS